MLGGRDGGWEAGRERHGDDILACSALEDELCMLPLVSRSVPGIMFSKWNSPSVYSVLRPNVALASTLGACRFWQCMSAALLATRYCCGPCQNILQCRFLGILYALSWCWFCTCIDIFQEPMDKWSRTRSQGTLPKTIKNSRQAHIHSQLTSAPNFTAKPKMPLSQRQCPPAAMAVDAPLPLVLTDSRPIL